MKLLKQHYLICILAMALFNGVCVANETGVTDSLHAGEVRVDFAYTQMSASPSGTLTVGSNISSVTGTVTQNGLATSYNLGLTNKINLKLGFGFSQNTTQELDYILAPDSYVNTTHWQGSTPPDIGLQYALAKKKESGIGAIVYGAYTPASPVNIPTAEVKVNGSVMTGGIPGSAGSSSPTTKIGATVSLPVYAGDAYANIEYIDGINTVNSITFPSGSSASLTLGLEGHTSETATILPYIRATSIGGSYNGQDQSTSYSSYDFGIRYIKDISSSFSLEMLGQFSTLNNAVTYYANGNILTLAQSSFTLGLKGMFFY